MNRIVRLHSIIQMIDCLLNLVWVHFHRLTSLGTIASRGFPDQETIPYYSIYNYTISFSNTRSYFTQASPAQFKTINQVLDYLIV